MRREVSCTGRMTLPAGVRIEGHETSCSGNNDSNKDSIDSNGNSNGNTDNSNDSDDDERGDNMAWGNMGNTLGSSRVPPASSSAAPLCQILDTNNL